MHYPEIQFLIMRSHYQPLGKRTEPNTINYQQEKFDDEVPSSEDESEESDDDETANDSDDDNEI